MDSSYIYPEDYEYSLIPANLLESDEASSSASNNFHNQGPKLDSLVLPSQLSFLADSSGLISRFRPSSTRADASGSVITLSDSINGTDDTRSTNNAAHFRIFHDIKAYFSALQKFGNTTARTGHRPFEQFKDHVETLWQSLSSCQLWRKSSKSSSSFVVRIGRFIRSSKYLRPALRHLNPEPPKCEIERLRGGSYNRVIGITVPDTYQKGSADIDRRFILRIPRDHDARLDRDVATLEYIRDQSSIPVPEIVHTDFTCQNPIESPYMIQKRIAGRPLVHLWDDLNVEQRCSVASDIGKTLNKLQSLTYPAPGTIDSYELVAKGLRKTVIAPYDLIGPEGIIEKPEMDNSLVTTKHVSLIDFFLAQCKRWRNWELAKPKEKVSDGRMNCWYGVGRCAMEMDDMGLLKDNTYSLCHLDLQPRNIMAEIQDNQTVKITGYLDWDSAVFAPSFVGCAPPYWMWYGHGWHSLNEELERGSNMKPFHPINQKVKQAFEDAVGWDYLHLAYQPQYRLARKLFRVAKDGIWDARRAGDAMDLPDEWMNLRILLLPEEEVDWILDEESSSA